MIIDPNIYTNRGIFDEEINRLFNARYFVGSAAEFKEIDCFKSFQLGKKMVTVRRTAEGIRAFSNVCLHRSAILDPLGTGKQSFRCRYHGWRYGAGGELSHTPFVALDEIRNCNLQTYPIASVNDRIFVGLNGQIPEVGKVPKVLAACGLHDSPSEPFHTGTTMFKCNWKQLVESVAENYHLNFVHGTTFIKESYRSTGRFDWLNDEYVFQHEMAPTGDLPKGPSPSKLFPAYDKRYSHAFVFPNLFVANTENLIGFQNRLTPIEPGITLSEWSLYELPALQQGTPGIRQFIRDNAIKFTIAAQSEDQAVIESCGQGISQENANVQLQVVEGQLRKFHEFYREEMRDVF
ncbi:aromatic ring-hydroxylating oxygenase subunit alpha [Rhodanobacter sp. BL-MT-08]